MTGDPWGNLYQGKVFGLQALEEQVVDPLRSGMVQVFSDIFGAGGVLDTKAALSVSADEFTLAASREGYTPAGYRLQLDASNAARWQDIPFENSGATSYTIGARWNDLPQATEGGTDGLPHFRNFVEDIAEIFTPDSVAVDAGGGLLLTMTTAIPEGMKATTSTEPRLCRVWYQDANGDPASSSTTLAIETTNLVRVGGPAWQVVTANTFGQAAPDLTAARYRVAVLGPIPFRTSELPGNFATDWLELGAIVAGVFSDASQPLVNNFGATIVAFNVEHNSTTGVHLDVTAETVSARESGADSVNNSQVQVEQSSGLAKVQLRAGDPTASNGEGGGSVHFPNPAQSADNSCGITVTNPNPTTIHLRNRGTSYLDVEIDAALRKNPNKAVPFTIEANDASNEELDIQNVGAGRLDVRLIDGDLLVQDSSRRVMAPLFTCVPQATALAYAYDQRVEFTEDYSPILGGWTSLINTSAAGDGEDIEYVTGVGVQYVRPLNASGVLARVRLPLPITTNLARTGPAETTDRVRIRDVTIRYLKVNAGDQLQVQINRHARDGSTTSLSILNIIAAQSAVLTTQVSLVTDHVVDHDFVYFLELLMETAVAVDDVQLHNVQVRYDKFGVE